MAIYKTYKCPFCEGMFDFMHHPNDEPPPNFCPLCGADVSGKKPKKMDRVNSPGLAERVNRLPRPGGRKSKSVDMVYRGMENASQDRMSEAAELLGCDPRSLSSMKMTDMKDNLRSGDESLQSHTPSKATELRGEAPTFNLGGGKPMQAFQGAAAQEYAKTVGVGPSPFAGNAMRNKITSAHATTAQRVMRAGQLNRK